MSNERIDQILKDPSQHPMKVIEGLLPEITRLRQLVKAQKELIELILSCNIKNGFISMSLYQANQRTRLIDKIKSFEA